MSSSKDASLFDAMDRTDVSATLIGEGDPEFS
jgi:hypothetical protein